jgi:hypothetical protein
VTVDVTNGAPVAADDAATTNPNVAVIIDILSNDSDAEGNMDAATVVLGPQPAHGTATFDAGVVTYSPATNFVGQDSFTYTVKDTLGLESNVATVTVTVVVPNVPPVAVNDTATADLNVPEAIDVLDNDTDSDGTLDVTSIAIVAQPAHGTAVANANGTVTYTPARNYLGADSFTYTVKDNTGVVSTTAATVSVNVTGTLDVIEVTKAQFSAKSGKWLIQGTTSAAASTLFIRVGADFIGADIGSAVANRKGKFKFTIKGSQVAPDASATISLKSSGGTLSSSFPVTIK